MSDLVRSEQRGQILEIILNRPDKRNAINLEMYRALQKAVEAAARADSARAVLLRGEGRLFSSGIDVTTFMLLAQEYGRTWPQRMRTITDNFQRVLTQLERLELPTIALIHGHCLGLALELALACDMRIAADDARLALSETRLGMIPDVGGTTRLTRLVGPARAKEMIMTGREIDAACAERWGLVNRVVPPEGLLDAGMELANKLLKAAPLAVGMAKRVIDGLADIDRGLQLEGWAQSQLFQTADFQEAIESFMMRREPNFKGK
jgi:enoyl-CoA hydratase/carnithine racemase